MNKMGLTDAVYEKMGGTKKSAEELVDFIFDTIAGELKNGGEVTIAGFGSFGVKERKAREARNPRTGETVHVPATKAPKFRSGKALKEAVK